MKFIKYLVLGVFFGIILSKAEVISWYRIYEMFKFQSFHMYGVIGSAVLVGIIFIAIVKKTNLKSLYGETIVIPPKQLSIPRYLYGGIIFGLGWALLGACPGPMFILLGSGYSVLIIPILAAILGTYTYGVVRDKIPH
ncbi:DUF6691 family protein [Membranihabitans maritimus]|uniref:DUF6691 family protein n=1 Tax=Membranihabitans maritimus TaxID=2904244 RepID=UPI001F2D7BBC|nr:DUF6691 family protein [Membranihabitans maritimus]